MLQKFLRGMQATLGSKYYNTNFKDSNVSERLSFFFIGVTRFGNEQIFKLYYKTTSEVNILPLQQWP